LARRLSFVAKMPTSKTRHADKTAPEPAPPDPSTMERVAAIAAIRALGKDPELPYALSPHAQAVDDIRQLSASEKRTVLVRAAVRYLTSADHMTDGQCDQILGHPSGRMAQLASHFVASWKEEVREKSWIDALTPAQQAEYAVRKRLYKQKAEQQTAIRENARAQYEAVLSASYAAERASRDELLAWVTSCGAQLPTPKSAEERWQDALNRELADLRAQALITTPDVVIDSQPFSSAPPQAPAAPAAQPSRAETSARCAPAAASGPPAQSEGPSRGN